MTTDEYSREQRLRKQAEIQSLYTNLSSLREREASYIQYDAAIPELVESQLAETRQKINGVEQELLALGDQVFNTPAKKFYQDAFKAENAKNFDEAQKLYKNAARHDHPDANAALRSLRYRIKTESKKADNAGPAWAAAPHRSSRAGFWFGLAAITIIILIAIFIFGRQFAAQPPSAAAVESTATGTATEVILIIPSTATPTPTNTSTATPSPTATNTVEPTATDIPATDTPTPAPTLRPAPKVIGHKDELVWKNGTIVFEFEEFDLAYNERYCLNPLKGYDKTNTENWSHPMQSSRRPAIAIESSVFKIARVQDIRCIVWSASIGVDSCETIISKNTNERMIGLPQTCNFD